jgi:ATP-dependent Clp protease protease subunit
MNNPQNIADQHEQPARFQEPEEDDEDSGEWLTKQLVENRMILISEPISDKIARKVVSQVTLMDQKDHEKPISVFVNSPGGSADSGFAIYDILEFVRSPVRTLCTGLSASAAVLAFLAGDDGKRYSLPNSRFLLHQPRTVVTGDASDIDIGASEIVRLRDRYNEVVSEITGKDADQIEDDADRDFWLEADEAEDYGLVDDVIEDYDHFE